MTQKPGGAIYGVPSIMKCPRCKLVSGEPHRILFDSWQCPGCEFLVSRTSVYIRAALTAQDREGKND